MPGYFRALRGLGFGSRAVPRGIRPRTGHRDLPGGKPAPHWYSRSDPGPRRQADGWADNPSSGDFMQNRCPKFSLW